MSGKVILKFFKAHGPYVKGDVAGFSPARALKLKPVARPYDPDQEGALEQLATSGDVVEVKKVIADAQAEFDARAADLEAREEALAKRELAISDGVSDPQPDEVSKDAKKAKAEPPLQGAKATEKA